MGTCDTELPYNQQLSFLLPINHPAWQILPAEIRATFVLLVNIPFLPDYVTHFSTEMSFYELFYAHWIPRCPITTFDYIHQRSRTSQRVLKTQQNGEQKNPSRKSSGKIGRRCKKKNLLKRQKKREIRLKGTHFSGVLSNYKFFSSLLIFYEQVKKNSVTFCTCCINVGIFFSS